MDTDEEGRIVAINRCLKGEKRTDIFMQRPSSIKGLLSKWFNRYKTGEGDWYKSQLKAPESSSGINCHADYDILYQVNCLEIKNQDKLRCGRKLNSYSEISVTEHLYTIRVLFPFNAEQM